MRTIIAFATLLALPLAGCADSFDRPEGEMTPDAGVAVRHNIAAQIANPNAPTEHGAFITDGERAWHAVDRYTKGKVTTPSSASTSKGANDDSSSSNTSSNNDKP